MWRSYLKLVRINQWYKNLVILLPYFFAPKELLYSWGEIILSLIGFCSLSSLTYIFNDWMDIEKDRLHPLKKNRPLASGAITELQAFMVGLFLAVIAGIIAFHLGYFYTAIMVVFFILTNLYSLGLKNIPILDLMVISFNFVLRMLAGFKTFPDPRIIPYFSVLMSIILILLTHKRRSDIKFLGEKAVKHKPVLRFYTPFISYLLRIFGFLILGSALYVFWIQGLSKPFLIAFAGFTLLTSILLSIHPELAIKPKGLLRLWYWDLAFLILVVSGLLP